jgi:hypothetical protein
MSPTSENSIFHSYSSLIICVVNVTQQKYTNYFETQKLSQFKLTENISNASYSSAFFIYLSSFCLFEKYGDLQRWKYDFLDNPIRRNCFF